MWLFLVLACPKFNAFIGSKARNPTADVQKQFEQSALWIITLVLRAHVVEIQGSAPDALMVVLFRIDLPVKQ